MTHNSKINCFRSIQLKSQGFKEVRARKPRKVKLLISRKAMKTGLVIQEIL